MYNIDGIDLTMEKQVNMAHKKVTKRVVDD